MISRKGYTCVFVITSRSTHARCSRDWSSDVCSSDLSWATPCTGPPLPVFPRWRCAWRSEERRVDLGGRRIIKKKKYDQQERLHVCVCYNKQKHACEM